MVAGGVEVRAGSSSTTTPANLTPPPPVPRLALLSLGTAVKATGVPVAEAELGRGDSMAERRSASLCSSCCM